jgi:hypothetical protein
MNGWCFFQIVKPAIFIRNQDGNRGSGRMPPSNTAEKLCVVVLDPHAASAAIPPLSAGKFPVYKGDINGHASR